MRDDRPTWGHKPDRLEWRRDWARILAIVAVIVLIALAGSTRV